MKYLLIENMGYEGQEFHAFESDLTITELNAELDKCKLKGCRYFLGKFYIGSYRQDFSVELLDDWYNDLKKKSDKLPLMS